MLTEQKRKPGTVKAYLTSVATFFTFLSHAYDTGIGGFPHIAEDHKSKLTTLVKRVKAWISAISRKYEAERWQQILDDSRNVITPEDTKDIHTTKPAQEALHFLQTCSATKASDKQFTKARDYLIARLELENGQRPGPMETATVRDFQCAERGEGGYVMFVARHKTSRGGPAPLSMTSELHGHLTAYVEHIRPHVAKKGEDRLFVTQDGVGFPDGTIGKRIGEWCMKAKGKRFTSTQLRKMAASTLHDANPVEKQKVHKPMCHSESTADRYYMTGARTRVALESHAIFTKNLALKKSEDESSEKVVTSPMCVNIYSISVRSLSTSDFN